MHERQQFSRRGELVAKALRGRIASTTNSGDKTFCHFLIASVLPSLHVAKHSKGVEIAVDRHRFM